MTYKLEIPIQIGLKEYLRNLPETKAGGIKSKVLPGLPPESWCLVDLEKPNNNRAAPAGVFFYCQEGGGAWISGLIR